ncbi:hypothetical protein BGZ80_010358 [Entomortierella chlamydospora]|uniref:Transglutaminase-like domain-containing protein n=1 Tax=Entomortierella chlamydospora TaxID=101097 RepID=A0A9P6MUZ1_9FUNG|nr:hypothetical protein BGZ79_010285 [Entomortierella chlamydospora]KAG0014590.1 hypothetical protein BGZ80_010358 [Entomortierella chlamydospora]
MSHTATRATTMYGSTTAIPTHSFPAPVPLPRPKSEVIAAPRRSLPPPPPLPAIHTDSPSLSSKPVAPNRPVPSLPPTPSSPTCTAPKRNLPPLPPPSIASTIISPRDSSTDTYSDRRVPHPAPRPISHTTPPKPDRHVPPPPPPSQTNDTNDSVAAENIENPVPLPRRPTSIVGLAKPPIIRPTSLASAPISEHTDSPPSTPTPVHTERALVLPPKRPAPTLPSDVSNDHAIPVKPKPAVELPKRVIPTVPTPAPPIELSRRSSTVTSIATPTGHPRNAVATALASLEPPKHTLSTHPVLSLHELPKRVAPAPPSVEPIKRAIPVVPTPAEPIKRVELIKHVVPVAPTPTEPIKRVVPSPPAPVEPVKRTVPPPPTRPISSELQQEARPPLPGRPGSQISRKSQNELTIEETPTPAPVKPPRLPSSSSSSSLQERIAELKVTPPSLPQRPTLPARPTPPQRPTLPQRPVLPQRPELPQRPALPKRPGHNEVHEHHSSSYISSSIRTSSSTTNGSSTHSVNKYSSHSTSSYSSTSCSPNSGDDYVTALSRSKPVVTSEFNGERLDLSMADFSVQDQHARACPKSEEESIARLSWYLTSPFPGDQVAQLRTIYVWIAENIVYNLQGFKSGNRGDNSAEGVLRNKTGVCAGYANLFLALSDQQQLGVTTVTGVARGYGIEPGSGSLGGPHAWNAVTINGECLLIDSTWGSGLDDPATQQVRCFRPFYFLVRPEKLIYSHWPDKAHEQFLNPPVHIDIYCELPFISVAAWDCGVMPIGRHNSHTVWTDNDYFELDVRVAKRSWDGAVGKVGANMDWTPTGERLQALCQRTSEDAESIVMTIKCCCPTSGSGKLQVYANAPGDNGPQGAGAITYKIVNEGTGSNARPMITTYGVLQFKYSVMEPIFERVQSGVMQTIRLQVYEIEPGFRPEPVLLLESGECHNLTEVEPGIFELRKVLHPGQYKIAHKYDHVGYSYKFGFLGIFYAV